MKLHRHWGSGPNTGGPNTAPKAAQVTRGTGKSRVPSLTHKITTGSAVMKPRKAKGPLDNRGPKPKLDLHKIKSPRGY